MDSQKELNGKLDRMGTDISKISGDSQKELLEKLGALEEEIGKITELTQKDVAEKLDAVKAELSEKVHNENVKCYRNVQSLVEEMKRNMETAEEGSRKMVKGSLRTAIILAAANLAGILGIAGHLMGWF